MDFRDGYTGRTYFYYQVRDLKLSLTYLYQFFPLCWGQPLSLVQVDLGLVEPGADVSQVLIKNFHFILMTLYTCNKNQRLGVHIRRYQKELL